MKRHRNSDIRVKYMQRLETEAIRIQVLSSNPERETTFIKDSQNTKKTYGEPSKQLFPERWLLSNKPN